MAIKKIEKEIVIRRGPNRWGLLIDSLADGKKAVLRLEMEIPEISKTPVMIDWEVKGTVRNTTEGGENDSWIILGSIWSRGVSMYELFAEYIKHTEKGLNDKVILFEAIYSTQSRRGKISALYICDHPTEILQIHFNLG